MLRTLVAVLGLVLVASVSRAQVCGNGAIEAGEQCDDGNLNDGDGCSASCQFEGCDLTGTWRAQLPGFSDPLQLVMREQAGAVTGIFFFDYGGPAPIPSNLSGNRNGAVVTLNLVAPLAGTMTDCDTLPLVGGFTLTLTRVSHTVCGDGTLDAGEECDDGNFVGYDGCSVVCTLPACGDGAFDAGEECDDGNLIDGDGCSATCRRCGNGVIDAGEECDDGSILNGDGCTSLCRLQVCGNSLIEPGENCDDGNAVPGDGCSAVCLFEGCPMTGTWHGDPFGTSWRWRIQESGGVLSGSFLVGTTTQVPQPLAGTRVDGTVTLNASGFNTLGVMLDCDHVEFLGTRPFTLLRETSTVCGDGTIEGDEECDDGNGVAEDACSNVCTLPTCGNFLREGSEDCDDGNTVDGDGCSASCRACGNGQIDSGEQCDDGNRVDGDGCSALCQPCGNGVVDAGEPCDDGNNVGGDSCSATCSFEGCSLTGMWATSAGPILFNIRDMNGLLAGFFFPVSAKPSLTATLAGTRSGVAVDLTIAAGPFAGEMLNCDTVVLDGSFPFSIVLRRLSDNVCGDGLVSVGEECDDGNQSNADFCTTLCTVPTCGNGVVDPNEACDDGNLVNGDFCDWNCTVPGCGNRIIDADEQCDSGGVSDPTGCTANCALPDCGNGQRNSTEACDDGNQLDGDGCARNCTLPGCGNGIVESGEQCDDGNLADCDRCSSSCQIELDGDADRVMNACDNCVDLFNPTQHDFNGNGYGDACDEARWLYNAGGAVPDALDLSSSTIVPSAMRSVTVKYSAAPAPTLTTVGIEERQPALRLPGGGFRLSGLGELLRLESQTPFAGGIDVCLQYDSAGLNAGEEAALRFLAEVDGAFVDVTTSRDATADRVCGRLEALSRITLGIPLARSSRVQLLMHRVVAPAADVLDRLQVRFASEGLDPTQSGLRISLWRGDEPIFQRQIGAGLWQAAGRGRYRFSDPSGTLAFGLTEATLRVGPHGYASLSLSGANLDLGGVDPAQLAVRIDAEAQTAIADSACRVKAEGGGDRVRCRRARH